MILPEQNPIAKILEFPLGPAIQKPRTRGLTMVIDKGLGIDALGDLLETSGSYIDVLKFGFGTSMIYPQDVLKRKLDLARIFHVETCTGGTLSEIAILQGKFGEYVDELTRLGFTAVEISDGTINLPFQNRQEAISFASKKIRVITEVGKKLDTFPEMTELSKLIQEDVKAGSSLVIIEGRESGENVGIYGSQGEVQDDFLNQLTQQIPEPLRSRIMFEAPKKSQQVSLIQKFGIFVNLGNVPPSDVLSLECLRRGLRADTLSFTLPDID